MTAGSEFAVLVEGLRKSYAASPWSGASRVALAEVSLNCRPGTLTLLAGSNGSGKSTLLKILAGVTAPDRGAVKVAAAGIGYLPESPRFPARLTVGEITGTVGGCLDPVAGPADCERALETAGLAGLAGTAAGTLSHGQRQRLGLALALLGGPRLLLLDEPFNGLDPQAMRDFSRALRDLLASGVALVVSSHLFAPLDGLCAQMAVMRCGAVRQVATPAEGAGLSTAEMEAAYFKFTGAEAEGSR
jgi:ABC-type multidrug transport system ATPase subunit